MYYLLVFFIAISFIYYKYFDILNNVTQKESYNISTGNINTPYYIFGQLLSSLINTDESSFKIEIDDNFIDKFQQLNNNITQFTICQEDQFMDAYLGQGKFKKPKQNLRFVCGLYFEYIHFIVDGESKINNIQDFKNNSENFIIGLDHKSSGSFNNFMTIANFMGFKVKPTNDSFKNDSEPNTIFYYSTNKLNDLMNLFYEDKIDGIFLIRAANDIYIKNLIEKKEIKFININYRNFNENFKKMKNQNYYWKDLDTSYYYKDVFESLLIPTIAVRSILITNNSVPTGVVYTILKTIFMNIGKFLVAITNISIDLNKNYIGGDSYNLPNDFEPVEMAYINKLIPMHVGAIQYYKSINLITNDKNIKYDLEYYSTKAREYYWKYQY